MQNIIRFSLFGNYERFATSNTELYLKMINFFGNKAYKPATANELQLQGNGQVKVLIMPTFIDETGTSIEIMSNRINFQKSFMDDLKLIDMTERFRNDCNEIMTSFVSEIAVKSNRLALNVEIEGDCAEKGFTLQSSYFSNKELKEWSLRNTTQVQIENESCNVICEQLVDITNNHSKMIYDINTIPENQIMRFEASEVAVFLDSFINATIEIEEGLA